MTDQPDSADELGSSQIVKFATLGLLASLVGFVCLGLMCRPGAPSPEQTPLAAASAEQAKSVVVEAATQERVLPPAPPVPVKAAIVKPAVAEAKPQDKALPTTSPQPIKPVVAESKPKDTALPIAAPPIEPSTLKEAPEDLLAKVDLRSGIIVGQASIKDGHLVTDHRYVRSLVTIRRKLPKSYDIELLITRMQGSGAFIIGLNILGQPCMLTMDGYPRSGGLCAIYEINGRPPDHWEFSGPKHTGSLIKPKKPTRLVVQVRDGNYWFRVDDELILDGDMSGKTLSRPFYYKGPPADSPFIGSYESGFVVEQITLRGAER